jgi:hypothetical protein
MLGVVQAVLRVTRGPPGWAFLYFGTGTRVLAIAPLPQ